MLLAAGDDAGAMELQKAAWESALLAADWPQRFQRDLAELAEHAGWLDYLREVVTTNPPASQATWPAAAGSPPPHGVNPDLVVRAIGCFARTGEPAKARDLLEYVRAARERGVNRSGHYVYSDLTINEAEVRVLQAESLFAPAEELQREVVYEWRHYGKLQYETDALYLLADLEASQGKLEEALATAHEAFELDLALVSELYYGSVLLHFGSQDISREWPAYAKLLRQAGETVEAQRVDSAYIAVQKLRSRLLAGFPELDSPARKKLAQYRRLSSLRRRIIDEYLDFPHLTDRHLDFLKTHYYAPPRFIEQYVAEQADTKAAMQQRADELAGQAAQALIRLAAADPELAALIRLKSPPAEPGDKTPGR
jgi:hypothetical protein